MSLIPVPSGRAVPYKYAHMAHFDMVEGSLLNETKTWAFSSLFMRT